MRTYEINGRTVELACTGAVAAQLDALEAANVKRARLWPSRRRIVINGFKNITIERS